MQPLQAFRPPCVRVCGSSAVGARTRDLCDFEFDAAASADGDDSCAGAAARTVFSFLPCSSPFVLSLPAGCYRSVQPSFFTSTYSMVNICAYFYSPAHSM